MTTELDLSAAQIAEHYSIPLSTINNWKRAAERRLNRKLGTKYGRELYFSAAEVEEIVSQGQIQSTPPQQSYQSEDVEDVEDTASLALYQNSSELVGQLQGLIASAISQEKELIDTTVKILAPENRLARVMHGINQGLQRKERESLVIRLGNPFEDNRVLPPSSFI